MSSGYAWLLNADEENKTIVFERNNLIFVFNFGQKSLPNYQINVKQSGDYRIVFSTDEKRFGGFENIDENAVFPSEMTDGSVTMKVYNVARTATVYRTGDINKI